MAIPPPSQSPGSRRTVFQGCQGVDRAAQYPHFEFSEVCQKRTNETLSPARHTGHAAGPEVGRTWGFVKLTKFNPRQLLWILHH